MKYVDYRTCCLNSWVLVTGFLSNSVIWIRCILTLFNRSCSCKLYYKHFLKCKYNDNFGLPFLSETIPFLHLVSWTFRGEALNVYYDGTWIPNKSFSSIYIFLFYTHKQEKSEAHFHSWKLYSDADGLLAFLILILPSVQCVPVTQITCRLHRSSDTVC